MEVAKEIETSDDLRPWRWYAGALQQHSFATLILIEVFGYPCLDYAKRAWELLDWIFQVPSSIPDVHKGRWILEGAVGVMKEYLKARKLRCPTFMDERLEIVPSSFRTPKLAEAPVTSEARASGLGIPLTSDAQATIKHEINYKDTEQVSNDKVYHPTSVSLPWPRSTDCLIRTRQLETYSLLYPLLLKRNGIRAKNPCVHLALLTLHWRK